MSILGNILYQFFLNARTLNWHKLRISISIKYYNQKLSTMKKLFVVFGLLVGITSFSQNSVRQIPKSNLTNNKSAQDKTIFNLIGSWEIIGARSEGGGLEILDSNSIVMTFEGQKKPITSCTFDFSKSPIWFDFSVKEDGDTMVVKSIIEVISEDLVKWQVFMDEERTEHFTASKGEMFYLKRNKIKTVVTFASQWHKKN